jgi:hypothetical protein
MFPFIWRVLHPEKLAWLRYSLRRVRRRFTPRWGTVDVLVTDDLMEWLIGRLA